MFLCKYINLKKVLVFVCTMMCCFFAYSFSNNKTGRNTTKENFYLEPFARIIRQVEKPSLINYRIMDLGLYNYCGIVPKYKHFSMTNIRTSEIDQGVKDYIDKEKVDFIFTIDLYSFNGYECVYKQEFNDYDNKIMLCLYKKKDIVGGNS